MLQQKRMHDVEWEWLNVISMTQLSGAPILKNSAQFNNDITLAHARARARAHTHTMSVPVTGLNDYKCKLIRGCSITVSHGVKRLQMQVDQGLFNYRFKWTNLGEGGQFLSGWSGFSSRYTIRGGPMDKYFLSWSGVHNYHLQWISCPSLSEMGLNSCHRAHQIQRQMCHQKKNPQILV